MIYELPIYEAFYLEGKEGPHGLTFQQSLNFKGLHKVGRHDYFQWLFPTDLESTFNKLAPMLDHKLLALLCLKAARQKIAEAHSRFCDYLC